tara:strand:- start:167 stop:586 length:420 start_codon:yes stop_codon:yes gene_type:complete
MQTKEEKREYMKKYYQANKEKILPKQKKYNQANKEEIAAYCIANKEKISAKKKVWYEAKKDGYYTVYYLKEEHYAGMTSSLTIRLKEHKNEYKRHVEDVEIIGKYETKEEASRVEAELHSMGYLGRHPKAKQQTLKQLL